MVRDKLKKTRRSSVTSVLMAGFLAIVSVASAFVPQAYATPQPSSDQHLITIHDDGSTRGIISTKDTLREIFKGAGIVLDERDIVEPGLDEKLVGSNYQVNIYRARPLTVIDGPSKIRVMSAAQTPKQIAKDAGISLRDEDTATVELSSDVITNGASTVMKVKRALPVKLTLYGSTDVVYTQAVTVGDFLKEKNIELGSKDKMSLGADHAISSGMSLEVWREGKQVQTRQEKIDFSVRQIQDTEHEVGYKKVQTPGKAGKKMVTYELTVKNGKVVKKKALQTVVITKPTEEVDIVGAKQQVFGGNCGSWMAAAGISDTANANYLIGAESGCNPYAVNRYSGACGVGQELPCGKSGCQLGDGSCQTKWMNSYVLGRYGSWAAAAAFHRLNGWY